MSMGKMSLCLSHRLELAGSSKTRQNDREKDVKGEVQSGEMERCSLCQNSERYAQELEDLLKKDSRSIGIKVTFFGQEFVFTPGQIMKACRLYQQRCPWCQGKGVLPVGIKARLYT